jgi:phosphate transport system substrate-binding protein
MVQRICTNYGKCALADDHEDFSNENEVMNSCPLCDSALTDVIDMALSDVKNVAPVENLYAASKEDTHLAPIDNLYASLKDGRLRPANEDRFVAPREDNTVPAVDNMYVAPREDRIEDSVLVRCRSRPEPRQKVNSIFSDLALALVCIAFLVVAAGKDWIKAPQNANAAEIKLIHRNAILRLAGSDIVGDRLGPALAQAFLQSQGATNLQIIPGSNSEEKIVEGVLPGDTDPSSIEITASDSTRAFTSLAEETCDIGMTSRRIKPDEAAKLVTLGNMTSAGSEHILGLDGIAVIVNPSNHISELRKDELRRIFAGDITDWSQVGSSRGAIKVYARDEQSGVFEAFNNVVLAGKSLATSARRFANSNALSDAVSGDPNGIGFVSLPDVHNTKSIAVSDKGAEALKPTRLTVATEDYPLSRRLYLYTPGTARNKYMQMFVEFTLSKQGQEVVAESGFVSQNVQPIAQTVSDGAPEEYKLLTEGAQRLSTDFRFQAGKSEQDSKAQADLDRIASLIADQQGVGSRILLFGFSDNLGTPEASQALSLDQAKTVESELVQRGIKPAVVRGYGSVLQVASNDTSDGREMNRRVEIWIKKK